MGTVITQVEAPTWKDFLESSPPGTKMTFSESAVVKKDPFDDHTIVTPNLWLYCPTNDCVGFRWFEGPQEAKFQSIATITYCCKHCEKTKKTFALKFISPMVNNLRPLPHPNLGVLIDVTKFGEDPPFGPHTPAKLITLIGPDRDVFLKGRRAESQGLGIGAFAYYRRVVENQKNRLLDEIIKVAKSENSPLTMISDLEKAKSETQFTKAIESIKPGIPDVLKIESHNPLIILHDALSEGLHAQSDEDCLAIATAIRTVLTTLVERMDEIRKDQSEVKQAVTLLQQQKAKRKP